jgi:SNF2 family DNA or RNA helicase
VAAQNQATDRAHRIGQENTVTVYELIAEHTIEEQIQNLQKSKQDLAEEILSGEGISSILIDRDEILKLL